MNKEFTKSDLKIGMVVETRGNDLYFFIGENKLIDEYGWNDFIEWDENLTYNLNNEYEWDIIRVYKPNIDKIHSLTNILKKENLELIWERNEKQQEANKFENITNDEIDEILEEVKRRFK